MKAMLLPADLVLIEHTLEDVSDQHYVAHALFLVQTEGSGMDTTNEILPTLLTRTEKPTAERDAHQQTLSHAGFDLFIPKRLIGILGEHIELTNEINKSPCIIPCIIARWPIWDAKTRNTADE